MSTSHSSRFHRARPAVALATTLTTAAAVLPFVMQPASAAELTAPVFAVVSEGLTPDQAKEYSAALDIGNALRPDGSFSFTADGYATAPTKVVGEGRSEDGPTVSQALDREALSKITVLSNTKALELAKRFAPVEQPYTATPKVGNTLLESIDKRGTVTLRKKLDTTVSYQLKLGGRPVVGPGAKQTISLGGDGSVLRLTKAVRSVKQADDVAIITPATAKRQCTALYGGAEQNTPSLAYYAPPLAAEEASGRGAATLITPQYVCQPVGVAKDEVSALTGRLVSAAPSLTPTVKATASYDGRSIKAEASVDGGTGPYTYRWTSSSTAIAEASGPSVGYLAKARGKTPETVTLTVSDANGASSVVSLTPSSRVGVPGTVDGVGRAGGLGGALAEAGIEQTITDWQCAHDSADGFRDVMKSKGQSVNFDWRGKNAWEQDFKETALGGDDGNYVDDVDIQWYTGHGWSGGFTFEDSTHDDGSIVPGDASWGTEDLEWLNLESCQVLRDTNGAADYFGRWGPTMDGLHLINGFDTNAYCVGGGTGRTFASYLFPETFLWWEVRPAKSVSAAWAAMANDREPAGVRWRSMSLIGSGGVNNLNDKYWGQGSVGPDLTYAGRSGMIAISGLT